MNRVSRILFIAVAWLLALAMPGRVEAATISVDARAVRFGTTLPSTCWTGDIFFNPTAPAGLNLFACTATNTWVTQGLTTLGGDVSGTPGAATVAKIQGRPVASTAPASGQALVWNSSTSRWEPQTPSAVLNGDVVGASNAVVVTQIQGRPLAATTPQAGQSLMWNGSSSRWEPQAATATMGGDITGASGAATVVQLQGRSLAPVAPQHGQALVWNGSTTRWEPQTIAGGGGGEGSGASMASELGDLTVVQTDAATLTIGANCSFTTPCNIRFGGLVYSVTSSSTVSLASGTGNALVYAAGSGRLTVGHNLNLVCSSGCTAQSGITAFPHDSVPLFNWHATNGAWDASGSDVRAFLGSKNVTPGAGLMTTELSGITSVAADPTLIALRTGVPATSSSSCAAGAWAMDATYYYLCVTQNSWRRASLSSW